MTRVVTEQFLLRFATANYNEPSRGVNGSDHMIMTSIAPAGRPAGLGGTPVAVQALPAAADPQIAEGYSSAAGLGLVLITTAAGGAAAAVAVVVKVVVGFLG